MINEVIIINGSGRTGKDTFIELAQKYVMCFNYSTIDIVKEAGAILGCEGKDEKDRKFLSELKALAIKYYETPYIKAIAEIKKFKEKDFTACGDPNRILFIHVREAEEIKKLLKYDNNIKTLLIKNSRMPAIESNESDKNVEEIRYNYTVHNDGTLQDLETMAVRFLIDLK